tara:strand:+ start:33609 stop:35228 length:1620 start_codon:yes stop_codon:yes gene_type:complete
MAELDLSSKGDGNLTLGANQPVNPSQVNPISAPLPDDVIDFENSPWKSGLLALGSIAATVGGFDNPLEAARADLQKKKQNQLQEQQLKRQNTVQAMTLGTSLAKSAASMKGPQRAKFITAGKAQLAELGSPEATALFESIADSPERSEVVLSGLMEKSPTAQMLTKQDPTGESTMKWLASAQGAKEMDSLTDQHIKPTAMKKISSLTTSLEKMVRDGNIDKVLLDRVQKDGKITIAEIQELNDSIPEGHALKLTAGEVGAVSAERNIPGLRAVGISLAEDFKPEELSASGKTVVNADGDVVGSLVTSKTGGNMVQPPGGGAPVPLKEGEYVTTIGDDSDAVGLSKKAIGDLQKSAVGTRAILDNLSSSISKFDKEFLTFGGQLKFEAMRLAEKSGVDLSPENKEFQSNFSAFRSIVTTTLSEELHRLSGAAASDMEVKNRLMPAMPNADDSPAEFLAKTNVVRERLQVISIRTEMALSQGLKKATEIPWQEVVNRIEDGSLPLERMNALVEKGMSEKDAMLQVDSEFPKSMLDKAQGGT